MPNDFRVCACKTSERTICYYCVSVHVAFLSLHGLHTSDFVACMLAFGVFWCLQNHYRLKALILKQIAFGEMKTKSELKAKLLYSIATFTC